jgi:hypothetical protein
MRSIEVESQPLFALIQWDRRMDRLSPKAIELTRREWRELGFFYCCDDAARQWRLSGSVAGLLRFAEIAEQYSAEPTSAQISEHEHIGPHAYLELLTSQDAGIDSHAIHGSPQDIARLAQLVRQKLATAKPGDQIAIGPEYAEDTEYSIIFDVRDPSFDPSSEDPQLTGA